MLALAPSALEEEEIRSPICDPNRARSEPRLAPSRDREGAVPPAQTRRRSEEGPSRRLWVGRETLPLFFNSG